MNLTSPPCMFQHSRKSTQKSPTCDWTIDCWLPQPVATVTMIFWICSRRGRTGGDRFWLLHASPELRLALHTLHTSQTFWPLSPYMSNFTLDLAVHNWMWIARAFRWTFWLCTIGTTRADPFVWDWQACPVRKNQGGVPIVDPTYIRIALTNLGCIDAGSYKQDMLAKHGQKWHFVVLWWFKLCRANCRAAVMCLWYDKGIHTKACIMKVWLYF